MNLEPGTFIGPYEVIAPLGAGGMGTVYRARDPRLGRQVALKLLPEAFAADPSRRARFMREAKVLASLNHPNISTLLDVEESNGTLVLVLELVEGETVGDRLSRLAAPMPLREVVPVARQIVDALDAAHDRNIVHRDLKPDNIVVRPDGTVKVLDFGVAKVLGTLADDVPASTITEVLPGIGPLIVVGTPAYMSPEQARGEPITPATDIWAFGCVLYAMLAGRHAFRGETRRDTLTRVLEDDPDFTQLPPNTPLLVERLVRRCLEKDQKARLRHIADARAYLEDAGTTASGPLVVSSARRSRLGVSIALAAAVGALAGAFAAWSMRPQAPVRVTRSSILTAAPAVVSVTPDKSVAITHDGSRLLYVANNASAIYLRALDSLEPVPLVTAGPGFELRGLSISPDDQWVTYVENSFILKKISLTGGPPVTLARLDAPYRGGTWDAEGGVIFSTISTEKGLQRVSADGGTITTLTRPATDKGEAGHTWPEMLPDGRSVLFTILPAALDPDFDAAQLALLDLPSGTITTLQRGARDARYVSSGHLVFAARQELRAVGFDLGQLALRGTPVSVLPHVEVDRIGSANFGVSDEGTLVYLPNVPARHLPVWVDREGRETPVSDVPDSFGHPRISPRNDRRLVLSGFRDLFAWEPPGAPVQLSFSAFRSWLPLWMPDGERLVFGSFRGGNGVSNIYVMVAEGAGSVERLTDTPYMQLPYSITPDGTGVLFTVFGPPTGPDIRLLRIAPRADRPAAGDHEVPLPTEEPVLDTPRHERNAVISPDGTWLAYESDSPGAPGQMDLYVRRYPVRPEGSVWQVSKGGGTQPHWSRSGDELFYVAADGAMMSVRVERRGERWVPVTPMRLFSGPYFVRSSETGRHYDVSSDGRFLMLKDLDAGAARPIMIVRGWAEELKRQVR